MVYFKHTVINGDENNIAFEALCEENIIGRCTLLLDKDTAEITEISYEEGNSYIIDGIIKAAFNYAANRNYYMGICSVKGLDKYISAMNFSKTDKGYCNDIPSILMGSCKSCIK
jgi:hypothetical protein